MNSLTARLREVSPVRLIVSSFMVIIVLGTILLRLPISYRGEQPPSWMDTFFISTSCTCVTGLTMFDTWSQWTGFGQAIMLLLIQIGGLGLVTFTTGFTLLLRRKLGLRDLIIAKEYTNGNLIDATRLIRTILIVSFASELIGAAILALKFVPMYGRYGLWASVFTAVSAYCNAGFDIFGFESPGMSLCLFCKDPLVSITVAMLVVVGGIGFIVIVDIYSCLVNKFRKSLTKTRLNVHTSIVLKTSAVLLVLGAAMFFLIEKDNTLNGMSFLEKLNASFFQSAVARTAGFFTVPIGQEYDITKILTIFLMLVGASPSSTGGGIKTSTFIVLISTVLSVLRGEEETLIQRHRVDKRTVYKSLTIAILAIFLICITTCVIEICDGHKGLSDVDIIFEAVSAFGTVGLTAGITHLLSAGSKLALIITMFIGRVGPISLVFALTMHRANRTESIFPEGKIIVG